MEVYSIHRSLLVVFTVCFILICGAEDVSGGHTECRLTDQQILDLANSGDRDGYHALLAPLLVPRIPDSAQSAAVRSFVENHLRTLGYATELDTFVDHPPPPFGPTEFTNIIATWNPAAPRRLVLACHLDTKNFTKFIFIGATDAAASCAMLLDLAGIGSLHNNSEITLQLIFFDGEEDFVRWSRTDSLYGSRNLAKKWEETQMLNRIELFVLLDLIGESGTTFRNFHEGASQYHNRLAEIENVLRNSSSSKRDEPYFPSGFIPFYVEDDHLPFLERNVPVLPLISIPYPSNWHTKNDDLDHLDFDTINDINAILRAFVCEYLTCNS